MGNGVRFPVDPPSSIPFTQTAHRGGFSLPKANQIFNNMKKYKYWDVFEEIPEGWKIDNVNGCPVGGCVFITDGKSILHGGKRAILKIQIQNRLKTIPNGLTQAMRQKP